MKTKIKSTLCKQLIESGIVKPYDIIEHSFTDNGSRDIKKLVMSDNGIVPTITTRCDCLGVVVEYE